MYDDGIGKLRELFTLAKKMKVSYAKVSVNNVVVVVVAFPS